MIPAIVVAFLGVMPATSRRDAYVGRGVSRSDGRQSGAYTGRYLGVMPDIVGCS